MFTIKNVPVVIEPGVGAIEAEFAVTNPTKRRRSFPVHLFRVDWSKETLAAAPMIPSTRTPHMFSLTRNPDESVALIVYDNMGRLTFVFTRDSTGKAWEKKDVAAEHAGKTVTQFSVRFSFGSSGSRDNFMAAVDRVIAQVHANQTPNRDDVETAFKLLSRSRVSPVVMPIAAAKSTMKEVKI